MFTVLRTKNFSKWLDKLKDREARARIELRLYYLAKGRLGDSKSVGGGVSEARINYGPGYRLYYTRRNGVVFIMLGGGDKSSQSRDIAAAQKLAADFKGDLS